jgi:hypothetical protein
MYADRSAAEIAAFAKAAAAAAGIPVDDSWWPGVERYLTLFLTRTDVVLAADLA